jgi:hypothetical protein
MKHNIYDEQEKTLIQRYADGELLTPDESKAVKSLLDRSPEAKREFDEIKAMGNALRNAMRDETEQVDFRSVWASVNEGIERSQGSGLGKLLDYLAEFITPRKAVAAVAGLLAIIAGIIIVWELSLAPAHLEAAPTTVESIQYGDNVDIVVAVETLEDASTTVVWIEGININKAQDNDPPNEIEG